MVPVVRITGDTSNTISFHHSMPREYISEVKILNVISSRCAITRVTRAG